MKYKKERLELESKLKAVAKNIGPAKYLPEFYVGNGESDLRYLNIKVPLIRGISKGGLSFSGEESGKLWKIWDAIWSESPYYEALLSAAHFANSRPPEEILEHRNLLVRWIDRVDNWALSDETSNLYAKLFEADSKGMLPQFKSWNKSENPWEVRASVVGLLFYSRFRTKVPPFSLLSGFILKAIDHPHFYVQKGVGWGIRECWNVYPVETLKLIEREVRRIPPAGWTAATEKLPKSVKARLMEKRKKR